MMSKTVFNHSLKKAGVFVIALGGWAGGQRICPYHIILYHIISFPCAASDLIVVTFDIKFRMSGQYLGYYICQLDLILYTSLP